MNQLFKNAMQDSFEAMSESASDTRCDYDDGDPATIVAADRMPVANLGARSAQPMSHRSGLATTTRDAMIDYDDGEPATVLA